MEAHSRLRKPHLTEKQGSMLPSGKEFACQCRNHRRRRCVFDPWVGKIWRRKWQPPPVFLPGKSHGQRSLVGYSPRDRRESDTAEHAHMCTHTGKPQCTSILRKLQIIILPSTSSPYDNVVRNWKQVPSKASLVAQRLKRLPAMREAWARSLGREDSLEKEMATHSSILAWRIPWTEESADTTEQLHFHFPSKQYK